MAPSMLRSIQLDLPSRLPDFTEIAANLPVYLLLLVPVVILASLLRRVPVIGTLLSIATWLAIAGLLFVAVSQHQRFNPAFADFADALKLDRQTVVGKEVRIAMAKDGHFWANVTIDGVDRRMLIDSGATITALSADTATAAGLRPVDEAMPVLIRTANGTVRAQTAEIADLKLGNIAARELPVVVSPSFGDLDVLGMNFLSRLQSWRVEGRTLILVPHHPQPVREG